MGRKLDLSGLSDDEAEHVLQVVQRDMKLRKKEEERLSELRQELVEEGSRCLLLSRQRSFNQRCCIRCCSPFTFLLNPKRQCRDCRYNICKACRAYNKQERVWLCSACQKSRLLKTQSLEWFYNNVRKRFKRFGSAKVLKTLYRKHLVEHTALSELTEGSAYEESVCNEGSICGSDSAFYRQTEEHSMAETLSVALRVAEEAIDEAISKAEVTTNSRQENQNEARYLREHRGELVEELAKTIVEKIINRKKTLADTREEYDQELLSERRTDHRLASDEVNPKQKLWRSHSAFSLLDNEPLTLVRDQPFNKEEVGSALSTWKSVDWLDETGVSSVLKSPDGNWIALQSAKMSQPSLLNRRQSLICSTLESEPAAVSAHEGQGSAPDATAEPDSSWSDALQEIHRAIADSPGSDWTRRGSGGHAVRDSEGNWTSHEPLLALLKKVSAEVTQRSPSCRNSIVDVNLNVEEDERQGAAEQEEEEDTSATSSLPDNRKENNQIEFDSDALANDTLTSVAKDFDPLDLDSDVTANQRNRELTIARQQLAGHDFTGKEEEEEDEEEEDEEEGNEEVEEEVARDHGDVPMWRESRESEDRGEEDEQSWGMETDEGRMEDEEDEDAVKNRLCRLVAHARLTYFSSTDDDLDRAGLSEGEWEEGEDKERRDDKTVALSLKICQLEKEVRASQFSSTEDELDRVGFQEEDDGGEDELAVKVCKLAHQANATLFSSTEEELDGVSGGEETGEVDEESLWTFQTENAGRAAHLSNLVRTSRFSSTENEQEVENDGGEAERPTGTNWETRESFGDLDVKMFDLKDEIRSSTEKQPWGDSLDSQRTDEKEEEEKSDYIEPEDERMETEPRMVKEMEESPETREGGGEESEEEDEEFDRMINSMLTMTLEDMQGGEMNAEAPENDKTSGKPDEKTKEGSKSTFDGLRAESAVTETSETVGAGPPFRYENEEKESEAMRSRQEHAAVVIVEEGDRDGTEGGVKDNEGTDERVERAKEGSAAVINDSATSVPESPLTPQDIQLVSEMELYSSLQFQSTLLEQRYSAVSLRSITTEVLKVLNATEELLQGVKREDPGLSSISLPPNTDPNILDQQFSRLEENVYVAASTAYGLEAELSELEECARAISSTTPAMEVSFLEEQVASAAAKVHQSDLQVSNISARIAALKNAGLNVDTHATKTRTTPVTPVTLNTSRQQRRRLPAPPAREPKET